MAKNTKRGYRHGAVKKRRQDLNPVTQKWEKFDENKQILGVKKDGEPFKGVRKPSK